ncbi:MAG: hypothetical protein AAGJ80_19990 [Cyanobacteria bacterium J06553_1]
MGKRYELFTEQDLQAFADNEISDERFNALVNLLGHDLCRLSRTKEVALVNQALQENRKEIYAADQELAAFVEDLLLQKNPAKPIKIIDAAEK